MGLPRLTRPLYLVLALSLAGIAAWGFWPRAVAVEVARVTKGALTVTFIEEGRTRLRDRYVVSAPVDGLVQRIALEPGDAVTAGAQVALLRPSHAALFDPAARAEAEARWQEADEELRAANAAIVAAAARRDRVAVAKRRAETLARQQLIASDQVDEVRAEHAAAQANLLSANARGHAARVRRDSARLVLDLQGRASSAADGRVPLLSPVDGRVIRRHHESEAPVRAGEPLLELGDPRALEVIVEALTTDAMRVKPGTPVRLLRWGEGAPLHGSVQTIEPGGFTKVSALGVEEQRVLIVVALPDAEVPVTLGDGFRMEAEFQVWHADNAVSIPTAALFRDGAAWATYVIDGGRARLRHVRIGQMGDSAAEVQGGLEPGQEVVLYPGDNLRDGLKVRPSRRAVDGSPDAP